MQQDASTQSMSTTCTFPTFPTALVTDTDAAEHVLVVILHFSQMFVEESGSGLALSLTCNSLAECLRENASVQNCVPSSNEYIQHSKHVCQATQTHTHVSKESFDCFSIRFEWRLSARVFASKLQCKVSAHTVS